MLNNKLKLGKIGLLIIGLLIFVGLLALASVSPAAATVASIPFVLIGGTVYTEGNYLSDVILQEHDMTASREEVTAVSGQNLAIGTVIGKITKSCPTTGTPTGGNTGNGTCTGVTMGALAKIGNYILQCIGTVTGAVTTPATGTADGGNTGNGTCTGVSAGAQALAGTYTLECTSVPTGAAVVPVTGTAGGGNAGANTMTAVSGGAAVKIGTYNMVCTDVSVPGSEVFQVTDPDGLLLAPATVGVAYVNAQIHFTINDPGANAQAGDTFSVAVTEADSNSGVFSVKNPEGVSLPPATVGSPYVNGQINFTLNDGNADFIVGDKFTIVATAAAGNAGSFQVKTPSGEVLAPATVGSAYTSPHINFTLNDGNADFAVGDSITIAVTAGSGQVKILTPAAVDGTQNAYGILPAAIDASLGATAGVAIVRDAIAKDTGLVWPGGITNDQKSAALAELETKFITVREGV